MIWDLPGPRRFVSTAVSRIESGCHVVVVVPDSLSRVEFVHALRRGLRHADVGEAEAVEVVRHECHPCEALCDAIGLDPARFGTTERLLGCSDVPARTLVVGGLDLVTGSAATLWRRFLKEAGEDAQVRGQPPFQLVAPVAPGFPLPEDDVRLARLNWWGVFSRADLETAIEESFRELPPRNGTLAIWLRAVCRGVATTDPRLVSRIVEEAPTSVADLERTLASEAMQPSRERWSQRNGRGRLSRGGLAATPADPVETSLWRSGLLDQFDGSLQIHPSWHVARGESAEIERLIWIGQVEVILPLVEQVREAVVNWLDLKCGDTWQKGLTQPGDDALTGAPEIGRLLHAVRKCEFGRALGGNLRGVLEAWTAVRNDIAHRRMVRFEQLEAAIDVHDRFFG